mmetsp:Transcript_685/g.2192  ORF Transcript_685/g.2192 Transcript_685/m.2192 type:complete len:299 (+) Transcript_685:454-1350(+)
MLWSQRRRLLSSRCGSACRRTLASRGTCWCASRRRYACSGPRSSTTNPIQSPREIPGLTSPASSPSPSAPATCWTGGGRRGSTTFARPIFPTPRSARAYKPSYANSRPQTPCSWPRAPATSEASSASLPAAQRRRPSTQRAKTLSSTQSSAASRQSCSPNSSTAVRWSATATRRSAPPRSTAAPPRSNSYCGQAPTRESLRSTAARHSWAPSSTALPTRPRASTVSACSSRTGAGARRSTRPTATETRRSTSPRCGAMPTPERSSSPPAPTKPCATPSSRRLQTSPPRARKTPAKNEK